jgi:hypothetical protein
LSQTCSRNSARLASRPVIVVPSSARFVSLVEIDVAWDSVSSVRVWFEP